jgi:hypothetical protein
MEQIAVSVQRGNADIMIQAAQRARGSRWSRCRRYRGSLAYHSPRSRQRAEGELTEGVEGERQQQHSSRALACAARLIGLTYPGAATQEPSGSGPDTRADTEQDVSDTLETSASSQSSLSFIPETPLLQAEEYRETEVVSEMEWSGPVGGQGPPPVRGRGAVQLGDSPREQRCAAVAVRGPIETVVARVHTASVMEIEEGEGMECAVRAVGLGLALRGAAPA